MDAPQGSTTPPGYASQKDAHLKRLRRIEGQVADPRDPHAEVREVRGQDRR